MKKTMLLMGMAVALVLAWNHRSQAGSETAGAESLAALLGDELVTAGGEPVSIEALAGKKVGLYFSAQWCPPCRTFTPLLVEAYTAWQADEKPIELVFVSSDRNTEAMQKYMTEYGMNWLAIPYDSPKRAALGAHFGVRGIPTLVILDENGATLSTSARGDVSSRGAAAFDLW